MKILVAVLCALALASCGQSATNDPASNKDQVSYYEQWANPNATDAQIDALRNNMPRPANGWHASIVNVRENGEFTIIDTTYRNQKFELWVFEPEARAKARQLSAKTSLVFSGDLVQELSMTRDGARKNPEIGVYVSQVVGGGLEITQSAEGIAQQHQRDRQAEDQHTAKEEAKNRDSAHQKNTMALCQEKVTKKLRIAVGSDFSWFQGKTLKESETRWVYTDVVNYMTASGQSASSRFICTVTITGNSLSGEVKYLK